ncbi:MAG TPA: hypothetical protein VGR72_10875 [Candidatus Acidoferrales bacterium]|nr:hypothetical protein [Candidatus Acidoferrales bacterium]
MQIASIVFILLGSLTGFRAVYWWKKASEVPIEPGELAESGEQEIQQNGWIGANTEAFTKSADLNRKAAKFTAVSLALSAVGGLLGVMTSWIR